MIPIFNNSNLQWINGIYLKRKVTVSYKKVEKVKSIICIKYLRVQVNKSLYYFNINTNTILVKYWQLIQPKLKKQVMWHEVC